jgi:HK97 gp10 family phage protein
MVKGLAELERRWQAIPEAVRINTRAAMEDVATDLTEEMWSRAPYRTGVLAASIGWTWGLAPSGALTIGTVGGKEYGTQRITIYAGGGDAFYVRFLEFGTVQMPAQPFFFPIWRARKRSVKSRISSAINRAIKGQRA